MASSMERSPEQTMERTIGRVEHTPAHAEWTVPVRRVQSDIYRLEKIWATGADAAYEPKIASYVQEMAYNLDTFRRMLFWVDRPEAQHEWTGRYPMIEQRPFNSLMDKAGNSNRCLQHGAFLKAMHDVPDDAIVVYTDGDLRLQRTITTAEEVYIDVLPHDTFLAGPNAGPLDTLQDEAGRLRPRHAHMFEFKTSGLCFNTGVLIARKQAWKKLYAAYCQHWSEVDQVFSHYAKQQWLISALIGIPENAGLRTEDLPYTFHLHGHYGLPEGSTWYEDRLYYRGTRVLLAHAVDAWRPRA